MGKAGKWAPVVTLIGIRTGEGGWGHGRDQPPWGQSSTFSACQMALPLTSQAPTGANSPSVHISLSRTRPRCLPLHSWLEMTFRRAMFRTVLSPVPTVKGMGRRGSVGGIQSWASWPKAVPAPTLCSYLWSRPSLRSHSWCLEAPHTAQGAGR